MMNENSLRRLRILRKHIQRALEMIRANESFRLADGREKPERNDLQNVVDVLGCRKQERYRPYTYMRAVAGALEATMAAFTGRETLSDLQCLKRYLLGVLNKTTGKYAFEYQANTLFFLGRFRTKITNRIAAAQKVLQKKKS